MTDDADTRRRRAVYRACHRGTKEMDWILGRFAERSVGDMSPDRLALLARRGGRGGTAPAWAYLGGLSGAVTVMLSSLAANTALALSGTLALGLVGQAAFGLAADRWGLLGLPRRRATPRGLLSLALILGGSAALILGAPA